MEHVGLKMTVQSVIDTTNIQIVEEKEEAAEEGVKNYQQVFCWGPTIAHS